MEEQLPTPLNNFDNIQVNDQQNLVVQPNQEMPKELKNLACSYSIVIVLFILKFIYYFFLWIICLLVSGLNYDSQKHSNKVDKIYYTLINIFIFPNFMLSTFIITLGFPTLYYKSKMKIIRITNVFIAIKIPIFIVLYISLIMIFYDDIFGIVLLIITIGFEISLISVVKIFDKKKIKIIK